MNLERRMQNAELRKAAARQRHRILHSSFCILRSAFLGLLVSMPLGAEGGGAPQVIDDFNGSLNWQARPSDGVSLIISQEPAGHLASAVLMVVEIHGHDSSAIVATA